MKYRIGDKVNFLTNLKKENHRWYNILTSSDDIRKHVFTVTGIEIVKMSDGSEYLEYTIRKGDTERVVLEHSLYPAEVSRISVGG